MEEGGIPSPSVASNSVASPTADSPGLSKCFRAKSWVSAAISDASPSSPVGDPTAHHAEVLKHRVRVASLPVERGSSGTSSRGSSKAKIEEFTLHMTLERLRAFYGVLRLGLYMFASGVLLTVLAELLWRLLPPGRLAEWLISALSIVSWLLTALTVAVASTCPMEELDIASFIDSRPGLCFFMALPPALTAATRVVELPIPRILSVITVLGLVCRGCFGLLRRCQSLPLPTSVVLMELWCLDVMVSSSISGMARAGIPGITEIILGMFAAFGSALIVMLWVVRAASTIRFYVSTHLATGYSGFYFACRAYDLATGTKQWDEGRQVDIAIAAAVGMATVTLVPQILVVLVGRRRLFQVLRNKVEQSRNRQLQSGAFMAMLLDSYFVQKGQPWWLQRDSPELEADAETTNINNKPQQFHYAAGIDSKLSVSMESLATPPSLMPEMDMESRPDFVRAKVAQVSQDGSVFWVQPEFSNQSIRVDRKQQVIPWPQLLEVGRKNLRCIDWKKQYGELWTENAGAAGFKLSRPVRRGETIDFFVSHSWSDSGIRKFRALSYVAEEFYVRQGRHPTFWVDKFCIDQTSVEDGLRVLPVNVMACSKVLVLCGNTYPSRLWCAWELCVLLSFMSLQTALTRLVVFPFSHIALQKLARFDLMNARCYDPNEELRLRRVISAIGQLSFENKIQALGQLILDRETGLASGLLMQGGSGSWSDTDPEVEEDRSALPDLEVVDEASMEDCTSSLCPSPAGDAFLRQLEQGDYQRQLEAPLEEVAF